MIGRKISKYDIEILTSLQKIFTKDMIKIDYDVLHEPCIFVHYKGPWNVVYKLSQRGSYFRSMGYYLIIAREEIESHCKSRDIQVANEKAELLAQENIHKLQQRIQQKGFKGDYDK